MCMELLNSISSTHFKCNERDERLQQHNTNKQMINSSKQLYKLKNIYNSNCQKNENEKYVKVDGFFPKWKNKVFRQKKLKT